MRRASSACRLQRLGDAAVVHGARQLGHSFDPDATTRIPERDQEELRPDVALTVASCVPAALG
ncbi:hypothetical protein ACWDSD_33530 [Streptomyces spiralis]